MAAKNTASRRNRNNLLQRKLTWYARYYVPKDVQPDFGRAEVQRTLATRDKLEAHRRLPAVLAQLQSEVEEAIESKRPVDLRSESYVRRQLDLIEARATAGEYPEPSHPELAGAAEVELDLLFDSYATATGAVHPERGPMPSLIDSFLAQRFSEVSRTINDPDYRPLSEWASRFIQYLQDRRVKDGTWKTHERRLAHFIQWAGSKRDPRSLQDQDAVRYRDSLNREAALSTRVRKDTAATVRALFEWLRKDRRVIQYNPFADLRESILPNPADPVSGDSEGRRGWHAEELATIIQRLNPRRPLWAVFVISLYSGLRINEVCSMRLEHVAKGAFRVAREFAKNDNSARIVPIHPVIAPLVATLSDTSFDGHLISGLVPGGQDNRRGAYPSKRFSELRRAMGLIDPDTTFHSTRHNFATAAERAGIPLPTAQKLLGHARQNITLDRYSDGPEMTTLREAVRRITYDRPETEDFASIAVDQLVKDQLQAHSGNSAWKRKFGRDLLPLGHAK